MGKFFVFFLFFFFLFPFFPFFLFPFFLCLNLKFEFPCSLKNCLTDYFSCQCFSSPTLQDFMNTVAAECKVQKHHPEWTNVFNKTHIRWTTHKPLGLSSKDTFMANFCDEAGTRHGELADVVDGGHGVVGDDCACGDFKP
jgi:pterin-4a-carbinolamine dehydratase